MYVLANALNILYIIYYSSYQLRCRVTADALFIQNKRVRVRKKNPNEMKNTGFIVSNFNIIYPLCTRKMHFLNENIVQ